MHDEKCLDINYVNMVKELRQTSWSSIGGVGARQWTYQTCTEFGWYQSSDQPKHPFTDKQVISNVKENGNLIINHLVGLTSSSRSRFAQMSMARISVLSYLANPSGGPTPSMVPRTSRSPMWSLFMAALTPGMLWGSLKI